MTEEATLKLDWSPQGRKGNIVLTATLPEGETYTDTINVLKSSARDQYINRLLDLREGLCDEDLREQLEQIARAVISSRGEGDGDGEGDGADPESDAAADRLIAIATTDDTELFHTPGGHDHDGYISFMEGGHRETWAVKSKGCRRWLQKEYLGQEGKAASEQAMRTAIDTLEALALFKGPEYSVHVRVAPLGADVYLDLGDAEWRCARISADGWDIIASVDAPVRFIHSGSELPLPVPVHGGSLLELRGLLNLSDDDDWVLTEGWLVMTLHPKGDYPVLAVNGEEGSAKTALCRLARRVVDPNRADLRRPPREELDLVIAASNSWVVGFDNFSNLSQRLSDAICCLSTGAGFSSRTLYTNTDETIISVKRPVVLNGIPDIVTSGDLASRAVNLTLKSIPKEERRTREDVDQAFEAAWPRILGALLDAASCAIRRVKDVRLSELPRMADFAVWVTAAEPALGLADGTFMAVYGRRLSDAVDSVIEGSAIGPLLLSLLGPVEPWVGTATELLAALNKARGEDRAPDGWPGSGQKAANALRRLAPSLRKRGIEVVEPRKGSNPRHYRIGPLPEQSAGFEGQARASAGATPPGEAERADSRASALPALKSAPGVNGGVEITLTEQQLGWVD